MAEVVAEVIAIQPGATREVPFKLNLAPGASQGTVTIKPSPTSSGAITAFTERSAYDMKYAAAKQANTRSAIEPERGEGFTDVRNRPAAA